MGRNSIIYDANPIWWHLGRIVQIKNTRVWETQDRIGIVWLGDSPEESWTWWLLIENDGKKKYRAESTNSEIWSQKRKLWDKRRGQESGNKNSVYKEFWEIVGNGKTTGSALKETIAVSSTIWISVQNRTQPTPSPRSSTRQNERYTSTTRSPRGRSPSGRLSRLPCKDYLKELAPIHSVKIGITQNACSTSPRMDADLWKVLLCASPGWWTA